MRREMQALLLMLNAIRLQLFALNWVTPGPPIPEDSASELKDCLAQSARLADMAMEAADLKDDASPSTCDHDMRSLSKDEQSVERGPDWHAVAECRNCGAVVVVEDSSQKTGKAT